MFKVDRFYVGDGTKHVDLSGLPDGTLNVAVDFVGGTAQAVTGDFGVVNGNRVTWDSSVYGLYDSTVEGYVNVIYD